MKKVIIDIQVVLEEDFVDSLVEKYTPEVKRDIEDALSLKSDNVKSYTIDIKLVE